MSKIKFIELNLLACAVAILALLPKGTCAQTAQAAPPAPAAAPGALPEIGPEDDDAPAAGLPRARTGLPIPRTPGQPAAGGQYGSGYGGRYGSYGRYGGATEDDLDVAGGGGMAGAVGGRFTSKRESIPPVVVEFAGSDSAAVPRLEEDLSVMSHILSQSLERGLGEEQPPSKLGVPLLYTGGGRSVRAMYMGGFGALFMIKVNLPLLPTPAPGEEKTAQKPDASEWESARRELLGLDGQETSLWVSGAGSDVAFDPDKVEALKQTIAVTLKNASNIRDIKPQENVSVAVFGQSMAGPQVISVQFSPDGRRILTADPNQTVRLWDAQTGKALAVNVPTPAQEAPTTTEPAPSTRARASVRPPATPGVSAGYRVGDPTRASSQSGTVLTMRVRKADIDAFAEGKLNQDDFMKKIAMMAYPGNGYGILSLNSWLQSGRAGLISR